MEARLQSILPPGWLLPCQLLLSTCFSAGPGYSSISLVSFKENKPLIGQLSPILCSYWLRFLPTPTIFIGPPWKKSSVNVGSKKAIKKLLNTKYTELGPMTFQQFAVLVHFIILVALWFFREPRFV